MSEDSNMIIAEPGGKIKSGGLFFESLFSHCGDSLGAALAHHFEWNAVGSVVDMRHGGGPEAMPLTHPVRLTRNLVNGRPSWLVVADLLFLVVLTGSWCREVQDGSPRFPVAPSSARNCAAANIGVK